MGKNPRLAVSDQKKEQKNHTMPFYVMIEKCTKERKRRGKHEFDEIYFALAWMDPRSVYALTYVQLACIYGNSVERPPSFPPFAYERKMSETLFLHKTLVRRSLKTNKFNIQFFSIGFHRRSLLLYLKNAYLKCIYNFYSSLVLL